MNMNLWVSIAGGKFTCVSDLVMNGQHYIASQSQHQSYTNGERTKQGQAGACVSEWERERERDGQISDWDVAKCVSVLAFHQTKTETESSESTGVESSLVFLACC